MILKLKNCPGDKNNVTYVNVRTAWLSTDLRQQRRNAGHCLRSAWRNAQPVSSDPDQQKAISEQQLGRIKADITQYLASQASCVLVDPVCAVPDLVDDGIIARDTALLIGLDASGWDTTAEGYRNSRLVEGINARRVRELGGNGGKIMVYLRADRPEANDHNLAILRHCIEDFSKEDLLLVVEFLTYQLKARAMRTIKARSRRLSMKAPNCRWIAVRKC